MYRETHVNFFLEDMAINLIWFDLKYGKYVEDLS